MNTDINVRDEAMDINEIDVFCRDVKIAYKHGRIGESEEYFEFHENGNLVGRILYIAQKSGGTWFVYRIEPGKNGQVETLGGYNDMKSAVRFAATSCSLGK